LLKHLVVKAQIESKQKEVSIKIATDAGIKQMENLPKMKK